MDLQRLKPHAISAVLFLVGCLLLLPLMALNHKRISPADEATHADYAYRVSLGGAPREGELISQKILDEWACRGFYKETDNWPACEPDADYNPMAFPAGGYNYSAFQPPLYYAATGVGARIITAITPADSFVGAARLLGIVWMFAGMAVLYLLLLEMGVSLVGARIGALFVLPLPIVFQSGAVVTNDAPSVLMGSAVLLTAIKIAKDSAPEHPVPKTLATRNLWQPWVIGLVSAVAVLTKTSNSLVVLVAVIFLAIDAVRKRSAGSDLWRRPALGSASAAFSAVAAQVAWRVVYNLRALDDPPEHPFETLIRPADRDWWLALSKVGSGIPPRSTISEHFLVVDHIQEPWIRIVNYVLGFSPFLLAAILVGYSAKRTIAATTGIIALLAPPLLYILFALNGDYYITRYNPLFMLSLLPVFVASVTLFADKSKLGTVLFGACTASGYAILIPIFAGWI